MTKSQLVVDWGRVECFNESSVSRQAPGSGDCRMTSSDFPIWTPCTLNLTLLFGTRGIYFSD